MTNTDWIDETADTYQDPMLRMDGYDDCVVGVVQIFGGQPVFLYDREKVILRLMEDGMDREEAEEFHDFNQAGGLHGRGHPGVPAGVGTAAARSHTRYHYSVAL